VVRSDDNWQKGFPIEQSMKSLLRHVLTAWEQHRTSELDEDTLCAVIFNAQCVLHSLLVDKSRTIVSENDTYKPNSSTDCPKCDDVFATKPPERIFTTMYSGVYKGQRVAVYKYCPVCFGTGYYEDRSIPGSQITCRCVVPMHKAEHATDCPKCDGIALQKAGEGYEVCDACKGSGKCNNTTPNGILCSGAESSLRAIGFYYFFFIDNDYVAFAIDIRGFRTVASHSFREGHYRDVMSEAYNWAISLPTVQADRNGSDKR